VILDEGHEFRNVGPKHMATFTIEGLAAVKLVLTATPLQTSTKVSYIISVHDAYSFFAQDIAAIGRLIQVPFFLMEHSIDEEKQDMALLRRTRSSLLPGYDPLNDDDEDPIRMCYTAIAQHMQDQFDGRIIRRTVASVDWEGKPLIKLEPYKTIMVKLRLEKREIEIMDYLAAKVRKT
jgi:TATA-binding protein-associated factor